MVGFLVPNFPVTLNRPDYRAEANDHRKTDKIVVAFHPDDRADANTYPEYRWTQMLI